jgi:tRNA(Arg) A34 adenosine deaminase TadA
MSAPTSEIPYVEEQSTHYFPDGSYQSVETQLTQLEVDAMQLCLDMAELAIEDGNPPVGAVLISYPHNLTWGARTIDKTVGDLIGHAEIRSYAEARDTVGNDLSKCTLVTTAQPCNTCITPYAEGSIGKIVYAAPRLAINAVSGLMRQRRINMSDLLMDGDTNTVVIEGHRAGEALEKFQRWGRLLALGKVKI